LQKNWRIALKASRFMKQMRSGNAGTGHFLPVHQPQRIGNHQHNRVCTPHKLNKKVMFGKSDDTIFHV
jgi:hypothetical protein